jgi:membrane associated rhomboid family serine protease
MPEWIAVLIAGGVGGLVNVYLVKDSFKGFGFRRRSSDQKVRFDIDIAVGPVIVGAIAGGVFWGLYDPNPSFTVSVHVRPLIGSLLAGIAGKGVLKNLSEGILQRTALQKTSKALEQTSTTLLEGGKEEKDQ